MNSCHHWALSWSQKWLFRKSAEELYYIFFLFQVHLVTGEWCGCLFCAVLVKHSDCKARLDVQFSYERFGFFVCKCGWAFCSGLRNVTGKLPRLWLNGHQCLTSPDVKVTCKGGPKHLSEKSPPGNNPREGPVAQHEEERQLEKDGLQKTQSDPPVTMS